MSRFGAQLGREIGEPVARASASAGEAGGEAMAEGMGSKMAAGAAAIGVAVGALVVKGLEEAVAKEKATGMLKAQLDLTSQDAAKAGKAAGELYAGTVTESIEEGAAAVKAIMASGLAPSGATTKQLAEIATKAQDLTTLFEVDLAQGANAAGQMVKTGLAKNATEAFDILTRGFQTMGPRADDLADTMNEYSTIFRALGLDAKTSMGLFSQGMKAGARDTDTVADALKEFQIRSTDASESSADAFELLGMDAEKMTARFAKGGEGAATGLQLVLDKLRGMKDPVDRNAAAVGLFGTKAEDLGASLFSLDPSKAVADLGKVGGAAKQAGDDLRDNAGSRFEAFKRRALMGLGDVVGKYVLPPLDRTVQFMNANVRPALSAVGDGFSTAGRFAKEYGAWLAPVGVIVGGITILMTANAVATGLAMGVLGAYSIAVRGVAAVTRGWAAAQVFFNTVMNLNPIGLIVIGLVALGAALYVAYQKSETFRNIVQGAWAGIKAGWDALWEGGLKPGIDGFMVGLRAVGDAALWLWNTVLFPVLSGIGLAARVMFAIVATLVLAPLVLAFRAFGAVGSWLYAEAIKPAFDGIAWAGGWLWNTILSPIFVAMVVGVQGVGAVAVWLYQHAFKPAFSGIGTAGSAVWNGVLKPTFGLITSGVRGVGDVGMWLYRSAIKPAFDGIRSAGSLLWDSGLKPLFDKGKAGVKLFGAAFGTAKEAIGKAMGQVKSVTKTPVNFVIEWVYTKGIKATWDKVAGFVGLDKLPNAPKLLAKGGTVGDGWGPAAPMRVNRPTAIVGEGNPNHPEFVIPTDPKYRGRALAMWEAAGTKLMASGGIIGEVGDWLGGAGKKIGGAVMSGVDFLSDPGKMWEKATGFIRDKIKEIGSNPMAKAVGRIPSKMLTGLKDKIVKAATDFFGGGGNGEWARPVSAQLGTRYGVKGSMWSSGYHTGTDFPAPTGTAVRAAANGIVQSVISGGPYGKHISIRHGDLTSLYAHLSQMGVKAGQRVPKGTRIGAVGATGNVTGPHLHFEARRAGRTINPEKLLGYANGGRPRPGSWGWVGERGPELMRFGGPSTVFDNDTSRALVGAGLAAKRTAQDPRQEPRSGTAPRQAPAAGQRSEALPAAGHTYNIYPRTLDMTVRDLELLQRRQDAQARVGRPR
ncbi:peptidoglycan DD-metalloendopeptidase family protein [Streptomyces niveus]|uniref:peptidoglycan DD-metalloendopeptidase family protein n=1 Tax=Streptomyces niveus TaxID=193462 RepID=UPI0036DE9F8D